MACSIFAAFAERRFSELKFVKTFHQLTVIDDTLTVLNIMLKLFAFLVWFATTSLMFLPLLKRKNKFLNIDTALAVHAFDNLLNV